MATCGGIGFTVSSLAAELHGFPHRNRNLKTVDSLFDPTNTTYLEGVGFSAVLFLIVGIILTVFVCIYLCVRACCCQGDPDSNKRRGCNPIFMIGCVALACGGLILGYYGNEFTRDGVIGVADAVVSANGTITSANNRVNDITRNLTGSERLLGRFQLEIGNSTLPDPVKNRVNTEARQAQREVGGAAEQSGEISTSLSDIPDVAKYDDDIRKYDDWRWKATIGGLCFFLLILLVAILSVICKSVCFLQLNAFLALVALILAWLCGGVFIAVGVLGGDFCVDPNGYAERVASNSSREQIVYITRCGNCSNPFESDFNRARESIRSAEDSVTNITVLLNVTQPDNYTEQALMTLDELSINLRGVDVTLVNLFSQDINCTSLNTDYNSILTAACSKTLDGAVFTFSGCFVIGVMFVLLVVSMQLYWTRLRDDVAREGW